MPQDSVRSAVYRSFVTCDDPKGVVECRTIRKSKINPKRLEDEVKIRRPTKNLNSSYKEGEKEMESRKDAKDSNNPSSFQLMEVSRGAQKLNQVIDTWSNGMPFDGHSKEIARDLLKGALDLQESLIMLGKLQEASHYVAKLKKKQKEKYWDERIEEARIERTNSDHFRDQNCRTGFENPRLSDGSSRDCFVELRTAIRDSLARQNLLPPGCAEEMAYCDKRTLDSCTDGASSSSSQTTTINIPNFPSLDSLLSLSSKASQKSKNSNLIAKLMGLEEIPSKALQSASRAELEIDKGPRKGRPTIDMDMPKANKPHSAAYKVDTDRRNLKEMVETMHFKGLLKSKNSEGFGHQSYCSNASDSKAKLTGYAPPIVIIKPLRYSRAEEKEPYLQKFARDVEALNTCEVLRKLKMEKLHSRTSDQSDGALNFNGICRRIKEEETPMQRLSWEGDKIFKEVRAKAAERVVKTIDKPSSVKPNVLLPVNKQQKIKEIEKKVDAIQKVKPQRRKPAELEMVKSKAAPKPHNQAKVTSTEERKTKTRTNISRSGTSQKRFTSSSLMSKGMKPAISQDSGNQRKKPNNEKPIKEPMSAHFVVENKASKSDEKLIDSIDLTCENESGSRISNEDELLIKEGAGPSEIHNKEQSDGSQNSPCNITPQIVQQEGCDKPAKEANYCISHDTTESTCFEAKTETKDLLLGSPLFLNYAEELFHITIDESTLPETTTTLYDSGKADSRLLLDTANEIVQHKGQRCAQTLHPLLFTFTRNLTIFLSLDRLVEEVCSGIEDLRSYSNHGGEKLLMDGLYKVLERDLERGGATSGAWDLGWRHTFTLDEVEKVVGEIEKLVLAGLIEEMFVDSVV